MSHIVLIFLVIAAYFSPIFSKAHKDKVELVEKFITDEKKALESIRKDLAVIDPTEPIENILAIPNSTNAFRFADHLDDLDSLKAPAYDVIGGTLYDITTMGMLEPVENNKRLVLDTQENVLVIPK